MPKPRKPTALLELTGAFKGKPGRRRARDGEPIPKAALTARAEKLSKLEGACWDRIIKLAPAGVLKDADEIVVELTARLWARLKRGQATAADATQLRCCLQQLGMTPASRSNVKVPGAKAVNEFADA
jgi:hypothetical protein